MKPYDRVRVKTARFVNEGVPEGTIAYIVDEYDDGAFEVEVSGDDGSTMAQFVARAADLETAE